MSSRARVPCGAVTGQIRLALGVWSTIWNEALVRGVWTYVLYTFAARVCAVILSPRHRSRRRLGAARRRTPCKPTRCGAAGLAVGRAWVSRTPCAEASYTSGPPKMLGGQIQRAGRHSRRRRGHPGDSIRRQQHRIIVPGGKTPLFTELTVTDSASPDPSGPTSAPERVRSTRPRAARPAHMTEFSVGAVLGSAFPPSSGCSYDGQGKPAPTLSRRPHMWRSP